MIRIIPSLLPLVLPSPPTPRYCFLLTRSFFFVQGKGKGKGKGKGVPTYHPSKSAFSSKPDICF